MTDHDETLQALIAKAVELALDDVMNADEDSADYCNGAFNALSLLKSKVEAALRVPVDRPPELPPLKGRELHKGTGDVLKDLAHAEWLTDRDDLAGTLGKESRFVNRALRVAAGEIKELRKRLKPVDRPRGHEQEQETKPCPECMAAGRLNDRDGLFKTYEHLKLAASCHSCHGDGKIPVRQEQADPTRVDGLS